MHAADIRDAAAAGCRMPNLCRAVEKKNNNAVWAVAEVIGQVSAGPLAEYITGACEGARVERVELKRLPAASAGRGEVLGDNGMFVCKSAGCWSGWVWD
jgi:hypothetical protein